MLILILIVHVSVRDNYGKLFSNILSLFVFVTIFYAVSILEVSIKNTKFSLGRQGKYLKKDE